MRERKRKEAAEEVVEVEKLAEVPAPKRGETCGNCRVGASRKAAE